MLGYSRMCIRSASGSIVNNILGNPSESVDKIGADLNADGEVTVADAVSVVNIILSSGHTGVKGK